MSVIPQQLNHLQPINKQETMHHAASVTKCIIQKRILRKKVDNIPSYSQQTVCVRDFFEQLMP